MVLFKNNLKNLFGVIFWTTLICNIVIYSICNFFNFHNDVVPFIFPLQDTPNQVIIVTIDDDSLQTYGKWPWKREIQVDVLERILSYKPKKLGLDILYSDLKYTKDSDLELSQILTKPEVVTATQLNPLNSAILYELPTGIKTGFIEFKIDQNSYVRKAVTESAGKSSLAKQVSGQTNVPEGFLINSKKARLPVIGVKTLMEDDHIGEVLKDKYVLFGASALSLNDFHSMPTLGPIPGVNIHGMTIQQIIDQDYWQEMRFSNLEFISFTLLLSLTWQSLYNRYGVIWLRRLVFIANTCFVLTFILVAFNRYFLDLNALVSVVSANFLIPIVLWINNLSDEKEQIKKALSLYISPKVMQKILEDPSKINLGGKKYKASIMFTDIRGFTSLTEGTENVSETANLLNQILGLQTEVVLNNDGVVDKYIGDAVMAFWGAPMESDNYAYLSLLSAFEIQDKIKTFNQKNNLNMAVGVGINTGICMIGNFGSNQRLDFTAIGDTVNTASRIEGVTKFYDTKIVVSESTISKLSKEQKSEFWIEELDTIKLKGKQNSIRLYDILGYKESLLFSDSDFKAKLDTYQKALQSYYRGEFKKALNSLRDIDLKRAENIKSRCQTLLDNPPTDWDGTWALNHK